jgi:hypothetical protein
MNKSDEAFASYRLGPARPGHLIQHLAATDPPDEPEDDAEGKRDGDAVTVGRRLSDLGGVEIFVV